MSQRLGRQQAFCIRASVEIDGVVQEYEGHQILVKQVPVDPSDPPPSCLEAITHLFVGNYSECTLEMGQVRDASQGKLETADCGFAGRCVELIRCDENGVKSLGVAAAVACHRDSDRDAERTLIVKKLLVTMEPDERQWTQLFRESFSVHCV